MKVIADLHIHSSYSRATSSHLSPPSLERWAGIKGIDLLGTGDCTHPLWLEELRGQLDDAEEGFYVLKEAVRDAFNAGPALGLPRGRYTTPRFVLTGEIATIYKKGDRVRKIHHLVILPDFRAAAAFNARLEGIGGNIRSDGRPILGIDSRDLLALLLDADERALLIPAHIWTPWFSVLGAKSGFDSIEECYRDLTGFIPSIETGLSSNPPMNWALKSLDNFSIISSSDAHSPEKLGREATLFDMALSFSSLRSALFLRADVAEAEKAPAILGTIEFFPQEGKYHYDGHRKCGFYTNPEAAAEANYTCPVCGKALTRGVMGRVLELAERPVNESEMCPVDTLGSNRRPYYSLIPLKEIAAEFLGTGTASKKAENAYSRLIEKGGSEFSILMDMSREELEKLDIPEIPGEVFSQGIMNMRAGKVAVSPGYDGEYGVVRVFTSGFVSEKGLFEEIRKAPAREPLCESGKERMPLQQKKEIPSGKVPAASEAVNFTADQEEAVSYDGRETIIIAGPGTGKTAVLSARIVRLVNSGVDPASILALTFTVKAAAELRERIERLCKPASLSHSAITAATFHSFCLSLLREQSSAAGLAPEFKILGEGERNSLLTETGGKRARRLGLYIEARKRYLLLPGEELPKLPAAGNGSAALFLPADQSEIPPADSEMEVLYAKYRKLLKERNSLDFEDLTAGTVRLLAFYPEMLECCRRRFRYIFVDEYQDINFSQYMLIRLLAPGQKQGKERMPESPSLWVIGDPNQAIYGFRGADKRYINRFLSDYPCAKRFELSRSFRCAEPIISAAGQLTGTELRGREAEVNLYRTQYATEKAEAEGIAGTIETLIGGTSFFALDSRRTSEGSFGPGDCAVLVRTAELARPIVKALKDHGIPCECSSGKPWWTEEPAAELLDILRERHKDRLSESHPADLVRAVWTDRNSAGSKKGKRVSGDIPELVERLIGFAGFFGDLSSFLDTLDSGAASGIPEPDTFRSIHSSGVKVMTIHASKGLEFEQVFVAGLEEGMLPFTLFDKTGEAGQIEEERRLLYVAMTRAKQGLWLSWSQSRMYRGRKLVGGPSHFLLELEKIVPLLRDDKSRKWARKRDGQLSLF